VTNHWFFSTYAPVPIPYGIAGAESGTVHAYKLESGLYCELTGKIMHDSYVEYVLLYDMTANCISIENV
jgi:hypothetical protein